MAQRVSRVACPRCGANNFDNVNACWKCGNPLNGNVAGVPPAMPAASLPPGREGYYAPPGGQAGFAPTMAEQGDTGAAMRAAIFLGLSLPYIGLPVGWIFIMLEDPRRQAIGRACVWWSVIGFVIHTILLMATMRALGGVLFSVLQALQQSRAAGSGGGSGGGVPGGGLNPGGFNLDGM